jgi:hypothetical protein
LLFWTARWVSVQRIVSLKTVNRSMKGNIYSYSNGISSIHGCWMASIGGRSDRKDGEGKGGATAQMRLSDRRTSRIEFSMFIFDNEIHAYDVM